jgi:replicative DNA helicase
VVQPGFHDRGAPGAVTISEAALTQMILHCIDEYDQDILVRKIKVKLGRSGYGIDLTLLVENLKTTGDFEAVGGEAYLGDLMNSVHVTAHATHYAKIVRDKAILRELIHTSAGILHNAYEPEHSPRDLVSQAEEKIFAINDDRSNSQAISMHDVMMETFKIIDARMDGGTNGIATGFSEIDGMTDGMHPSELLILAARPSMGKTAFATNIADNVDDKKKKTTVIFSLEMARVELAQRMLCSRGRIDAHRLRANYLSTADRQALAKASGELSAAPL